MNATLICGKPGTGKSKKAREVTQGKKVYEVGFEAPKLPEFIDIKTADSIFEVISGEELNSAEKNESTMCLYNFCCEMADILEMSNSFDTIIIDRMPHFNSKVQNGIWQFLANNTTHFDLVFVTALITEGGIFRSNFKGVTTYTMK